MPKLIVLPLIGLLTAAAAPANSPASAVAQQAAASAAAQPAAGLSGAKAPAAEEKKICRQIEVSGSRMSKRACLTAKEWKQVEDDLPQ
ncbi:MAG: hypothetical protein ACJ8D6_10155 [Sphingomicrobium sp.]